MREKQMKEKQDFDRRILDQAKFELELEEKKRKDKEQQLLKNKLMRDQMLQQAKEKREVELINELKEGRAQAQKLEAQIEAEKKKKLIKKREEREAAMKVIKDN